LKHAKSLQELQDVLYGDAWFQTDIDTEETGQADWGEWGDGTKFEYDPVSNDELGSYLLEDSSSAASLEGSPKITTEDLIKNFV
jgi:hypothetical protein